MSEVINPINELANSLIAVLGLPQNVTRLVLTLDGSKPPLVECEFIPGLRDGSGDFVQVVSKYRLVPIGGTLAPANTAQHQEQGFGL